MTAHKLREHKICIVRPDLYKLKIPVGENKFIMPNRKRKRFRYRWVNDEIFEIHFNGNWEKAQSIYFDF